MHVHGTYNIHVTTYVHACVHHVVCVRTYMYTCMHVYMSLCAFNVRRTRAHAIHYVRHVYRFQCQTYEHTRTRQTCVHAFQLQTCTYSYVRHVFLSVFLSDCLRVRTYTCVCANMCTCLTATQSGSLCGAWETTDQTRRLQQSGIV